jgi:hypothetical protein
MTVTATVTATATSYPESQSDKAWVDAETGRADYLSIHGRRQSEND